MPYFYAIRVKSPPGRWIASDAYRTADQAKSGRQLAKAPDIDITTYFFEESKEEAQARCDSGQVG